MDSEAFRIAYNALNSEQKHAVDTIDGPVLVVAGPGTGKTQLLSARVANILLQTDTPAANILCLTFTESGATNMRERLSRFIGNAAYDVTISTYHALGADIIQRYPQYFLEHRLQQAIDELGRHQICSHIIDRLSYQNPLKQTQHHIGDLMSTISEIKRALLSPDDLRAISKENLAFIESVNERLVDIFNGVARLPGTYAAAEPYFRQTLDVLSNSAPATPVNTRYGSLAGTAITGLSSALEAAEVTGKSTPLTAWKNSWLCKNTQNQLILGGGLANRRLHALADVLERYESALRSRGLYDFDDMIIRAVHALEQHDDLRFSLQERYQYLLLDEFQDTNAAQLRLVELLTNNPLSDDRPNIMAVGDDDQAIYAFQGAQYSNMLDFYQLYRDVLVVNLHTNYRSQPAILETATMIAGQISERLFTHFDGIEKQLTPGISNDSAATQIKRTVHPSDIAERANVAAEIQSLIEDGVQPHEIAVLAPKHRLLTGLVPYLNHHDIPVQYEKRENILEAPLIRRIIAMARLVTALNRGDTATANACWPEILSGAEWQCPISDIWEIAWKVTDSSGELSWSQALLQAKPNLRSAALLHLGLAQRCNDERLEVMLDLLIGSSELATSEADLPTVTSPLRAYFTSQKQMEHEAGLFYETLSQLTVLRARLREHQATREDALRLPDLLALVDAYEAAEQPMLHTSPHHQATDAVQLMTVFKAKGLEFQHVFLVSCSDEIWGGSGTSNSNRISLPANLAPIRHSGTTEDERLRLLFVAITRAKVGLHISSYAANYTGKASKRLKYLDEREDTDGFLQAFALPEAYRIIEYGDQSPPELALLELQWQDIHLRRSNRESLRALLQQRISSYRLSPTHLNSFLDLIYGGPQQFFLTTILHFPSAPSINSQFGIAIHSTLEWLQHRLNADGTLPPISQTLAEFDKQIASRKLPAPQLALETERGHHTLSTYLQQRVHTFQANARAEANFKHEGVVVNAAHMSGKIDRLEIDTKQKTIVVVDYKTGKSFAGWKSDPKLHKYKQQLYCYKILVEHSNSFAGYRVTGGRLEFVEPDPETGKVHSLDLTFNTTEEERTKQLISAMWQHVQDLNFPDTSEYEQKLRGIIAFEDDLLSGKI